MVVRVTFETDEAKEVMETENIFGVTFKRLNDNQMESAVFVVGGFNSNLLLKSLESMSEAAAKIMIQAGMTPDYISKKIASATAGGVASGIIKEAENEESEVSDDDLDKLLGQMDKAEKVLEVMSKARKIRDLIGKSLPESDPDIQDLINADDELMQTLLGNLKKRQR